jgi:N,N'-diacetyllegionaminate synthase
MKHVRIIAEAGVNHNKDLRIAKKLIDVASDSGADMIKFQTYHTEELSIKNAPKAEYQRRNTDTPSTQYEMLKKLELSFTDFKLLFEYCQEKNITFLSSPFDLESADFLNELGLELFKIPSGEITDYLYLKKIAGFGKPILLSTGIATLKEIEDALAVLEPNDEITLLHCTSDYPAVMKDVNLKAMCSMQKKFNKEVGYSDHTLGIEAAIAAVALGACVIEKHITLDRSLPGPDQRVSLVPDELKQLVYAIRNIEEALGDGEKRPTASELKNKEAVRKSLVASETILQGEIFTAKNIVAKRPGTGISPMKYEMILGKRAKRDYEKDDLIET